MSSVSNPQPGVGASTGGSSLVTNTRNPNVSDTANVAGTIWLNTATLEQWSCLNQAGGVWGRDNNPIGVKERDLSIDTVPVSPHAFDDEFTTTVLAGTAAPSGWTASGISQSLTSGGRFIHQNANATAGYIGGVYKAISGNGTYRAKGRVITRAWGNADVGSVGIGFRAAGGACALIEIGYYGGTGPYGWYATVQRYPGSSGTGSAAQPYALNINTTTSFDMVDANSGSGDATIRSQWVYVQAAYNGTNIVYSFSLDGVNFTTALTETATTSIGAEPSHVYIGGRTGSPAKGGSTRIFQWVRKVA